MPARPLTRRFFSTGVILIVLLSLSFFSPVIRGWWGSLGSFLAQPVNRASWWVGDRLSSGSNHDQLAVDRDSLRTQVTALQQRLQTTQDALAATQASLHLEQFVASTKFQTKKAQVIAYSPDPGIRSIVMNQGKQNGLKVGMAVITDNGFFLGKVHDVHETTATVLLVTDGQFLMSARVQNDQQSLGLIRGERGLAVTMDFIPKNDPIAVGQTVVSSGTEANIPPGILVGTVASVETKSGALFQQAAVTSPVAYRPIREVAIILQ